MYTYWYIHKYNIQGKPVAYNGLWGTQLTQIPKEKPFPVYTYMYMHEHSLCTHRHKYLMCYGIIYLTHLWIRVSTKPVYTNTTTTCTCMYMFMLKATCT